ncbi:MAG: thiol reductant ABC exporter subunit CydC [Actinomycetota bacterium]
MTESGRPPPVDRELLKRSRGLRVHLGFSSVGSVMVAVAIIVQASALATGISAMMGTAVFTRGQLTALVIALGVVVALRAGAAGLVELSGTRALRRTREVLRGDLLTHAKVDAAPSDPGIAARRAKAATTGVDELEPYIRAYLPALTSAAVVPLAAGLWILGSDLTSAIIVALTVPLIPIFMVLIGVATQQRVDRRWATVQRLSGHFLDVLVGIPTLRLFGRVETSTEAVRDVSDRYRAVTVATLRVAFLSAFALELIATLSVAVVAVSIGLRLASGSLDLETALIVLLLVPECYLPLRKVGSAFHASQVGVDASAEVSELVGRPMITTGSDAPGEGPIVLDRVVVEREERGGLRVPVSLKAGPGDIVAIVGASGSGKTTVLDVIRGRTAPTSGSVRIGTLTLDRCDHDAWSDRIALINQKPVGIAATVRAEMVCDDQALVDETLRELGLLAYADTPSTQLSGGQRRRVEVARAVAAVRSGRASVVIADEPTAHLDRDGATVVNRMLVGLASVDGATVVVATHDLELASLSTKTIDLTPNAQGRTDGEAGSSSPTEIAPVGSPSMSVSDAGEGAISTRTAVLRVLREAAGLWKRVWGAIGLGTLAEISAVGLAGVAAWLVLRASEQPALASLALAVTAVRGFGIGKGVFRYAERVMTHDVALRTVTKLRATIVSHLGRIAPGGIAHWSRGEVARRVVEDTDKLVDLFARILVPGAAILITTAGSAFIAVAIDPIVGMTMAVGVVGVAIVLPMVAVRSEIAAARPLLRARGVLASDVLEYCTRIDALIGYRVDKREAERITREAHSIDRLELRRGRLRAARAAITAASPAAVAALAALAVYAQGDQPIGPVLGLLIIWPLTVVELAGQLVEVAAESPHVAEAAVRTAEILERPIPAEPDEPLPIDADVARTVMVQGASRWPGQASNAYEDLSFSLEPGGQLSLVGDSGAGKSTVAATLVSFLPLTGGTFWIDDLESTRVAGDDIRTKVTWIEQIPWLADSTIRENLRIADPDASDNLLLEVLGAVRMRRWIEASGNGLDTMVGSGGAKISGGEAQRIGLARALLSGHGVVVLDEPTAHLDTETAKAVVAELLGAFTHRSVIAISHTPIIPDTVTVTVGRPETADRH